MKTFKSPAVTAAMSLFLTLPTYLFAQAQAEADAAATQATVLVSTTRPRVVDRSFLDDLQIDELLAQNTLRHWLTLLGLIILSIALGRIVAWFLNRIAKRLENRRWHSQAEVFTGLARRRRRQHVAEVSAGYTEPFSEPRLCSSRSQR